MKGDIPLLHYQTHLCHPDSEWMVLIHGAGGSIRTWKKQVEDLSRHINLLIVDLPGHGGSADLFLEETRYTFEYLSETIWNTVDHLKLKEVHIGGVSLGSIIAMKMQVMSPNRVRSLVMAGAIVRLNRRLKIIANISLALAKIVGYNAFYRIAARIALPRKNHKQSRNIFIRESKRLTTEEFRKWTAMYGETLNKTLEFLNKNNLSSPAVLIMGDQDHLFLKTALEYVQNQSMAAIEIIKKCGHVVSMEKPKKFNELSIEFLNKVRTFDRITSKK